jgi:hypothetical protein
MKVLPGKAAATARARIKKALPIVQKRFKYVGPMKIKALYLTYLSRMCGMELAPYPACAGQVVKASKGHYPQPFLIRCLKELLQTYLPAN